MRTVRSVLLLAILFNGGVIGQAMSDESNPEKPKYALVLHGGAGTWSGDEASNKARKAALGEALDLGLKMLDEGKSSLDVVEQVVRYLEDSELFNAGKGAVFNAAGTHELDATIMDGSNRATGAVGGIRTVRNPISLARLVMTETHHVLLVTDGAEQFADQFTDHPLITRVPNEYFSTERQLSNLRRAQAREQSAIPSDQSYLGTVGCAALDQQGNLAAATSTGGLTNKRFGRLGDSPIAGAGTFADNTTCAVSGTGIGEDFIRNAVGHNMSARMEYLKQSMSEAAESILNHPTWQVRGGIIGVDHQGQITMRFNTNGMARAAGDSMGLREVHSR